MDYDTPTLETTRTDKEKLADRAVAVACKQLEVGLEYRAHRFKDIEKNEAMYNGHNPPALRGRNNVPFHSIVMRGFVDTLHSKIDEGVALSFDPTKEGAKKTARKVTAVYEEESAPDKGAWSIHDLGVKKLAIFSGRGIYEKYACRESGIFRDKMGPVDHWDFVTEPQGGGMLDKHLFKGRININRSKEELLKGAEKNIYHKRQVAKLVSAYFSNETKKNTKLKDFKVTRTQHLGGSGNDEEHNYVGSDQYGLVEWVMYFEGEWYNMVFNYEHQVWIRFDKLEDVYSIAKIIPGRGAWVSWATHYDPFVFWSIAPADSVRPIGYTMKKVVNLTLDNLQKRNWDMTAYNPAIFPDPQEFLYREDGLVKANVKATDSINRHIYKFETPDTTNITINLVDYLNNFLGEKTGITPGSQGKAEEDKVGIFFGNMQQVADRLGLTNKMYEMAHVQIGQNFLGGLLDHMPEKQLVKLIGNEGVSWDEELRRAEIRKTGFRVTVKGGNAEAQANEVAAQRRERALDRIKGDQGLRGAVNPEWYAREILQLGGYDQEDLRIALDVKNTADDELLSEAARAIDDILEGEKPRKNRGATTGYIRKIIDFAYDSEDLDEATFKKLLAFAEEHIEIAKRNMARKAGQMLAANAMAQRGVTQPAGGQVPTQGVSAEQPTTTPTPADAVTFA